VIARLGVTRLSAARVALLGTLRPDGSPRISPIEPYLAGGELVTGALAWSRKAADLRRDPRYVLHSAVTDPDAGEGQLKLYGLAMEANQEVEAVEQLELRAVMKRDSPSVIAISRHCIARTDRLSAKLHNPQRTTWRSLG
jgi:hypothetical protein